MPSVLYLNSDILYLILLKNLENIISAALGVDVEVDGLGKIEAEDTHDGLSVDYVSAGNKIEVIFELGNVIYEALYLVD